MKNLYDFLLNSILDPIFLISMVIRALLFFSILQDYLGSFLKRYISKLFNYLFGKKCFLLSMLLLFLFIWYIDANIVYCLDEDTARKLMEVKDNNISINNPTVHVPS